MSLSVPQSMVLAEANLTALHHNRLYNPVHPDRVLHVAGVRYSLNWLQLRFDSLSTTQVYEVTVTDASTGLRRETQVIVKVRRNAQGQPVRRVHAHRVGSWPSNAQAEEAIVAACITWWAVRAAAVAA
jgi:hypothetical protein